MNGRQICRTHDEIFAAGMNAACEHGIAPMRNCADCRLSPAEIGRLAVLHRPYVLAQADATPTAA